MDANAIATVVAGVMSSLQTAPPAPPPPPPPASAPASAQSLPRFVVKLVTIIEIKPWQIYTDTLKHLYD